MWHWQRGANAKETNESLVSAFQQVSAENTALAARLAQDRMVRAPKYKFVSIPGDSERDPCVYSVEESFTETSSQEMLKKWTVPAQVRP